MGTRATIEIGGGGGSNIGNSDLTISATGVRKLQMFDTGSIFNLRNSADTYNQFSFSDDGTQAIGQNATNTGLGSISCVVIGRSANNNNTSGAICIGQTANTTGNYGVTIGHQSYTTQAYATTIGMNSRAGLNSTAIGYGANASNGQYNISIGESANCSSYFGVAIGRASTSGNQGVAIRGTAGDYATAINSTASNNAVGIGNGSTSSGISVAIGNNSSADYLNTAIGYGMQTTADFSVVIGACPYASTRVNAVVNTFSWFTDNANPIVRFGETVDQWNIGSGSFGFGTMTPDGSAVIDLTSTTKGFLLPRMTTVEKNAIGSPATALMVYDTTTSGLNIYDGAVWGAIGGGGSNIGSSDLTISVTGVRKLQMFDTGSIFNLRNSADTYNLFSFDDSGGIALGYNALNTGSNTWSNQLFGSHTKSNGFSYGIAIGQQSEIKANGGIAIGYLAEAGLNSLSIGYNSDASAGQYNIAIGELATNVGFFGIAIGRNVTAQDRSVCIGGSATNVNCTVIGSGASGSHYSTALGRLAVASNQMSLAIGASAIASGWSSGLISMSVATRTNAVNQTLAVNFGQTDHLWRIGATADQWNIGTGSFGFGTMTPHASAVVDVNSTTKGFLPPTMTTTEKNAIGSPASGLIVYDRVLAKLCVYTGASWETVTSV